MHESVRLIGLVKCVLGFAACGYPSLASLGGDGGGTTTDRLTFSLTDFKLSQLQTARLHVQLVHSDGTMRDVTAEALYTSDNATIATVGGPGVVNSGSQAGTATITAGLGTATPAMVRPPSRPACAIR